MACITDTKPGAAGIAARIKFVKRKQRSDDTLYKAKPKTHIKLVKRKQPTDDDTRHEAKKKIHIMFVKHGLPRLPLDGRTLCKAKPKIRIRSVTKKKPIFEGPTKDSASVAEDVKAAAEMLCGQTVHSLVECRQLLGWAMNLQRHSQLSTVNLAAWGELNLRVKHLILLVAALHELRSALVASVSDAGSDDGTLAARVDVLLERDPAIELSENPPRIDGTAQNLQYLEQECTASSDILGMLAMGVLGPCSVQCVGMARRIVGCAYATTMHASDLIGICSAFYDSVHDDVQNGGGSRSDWPGDEPEFDEDDELDMEYIIEHAHVQAAQAAQADDLYISTPVRPSIEDLGQCQPVGDCEWYTEDQILAEHVPIGDSSNEKAMAGKTIIHAFMAQRMAASRVQRRKEQAANAEAQSEGDTETCDSGFYSSGKDYYTPMASEDIEGILDGRRRASTLDPTCQP